MVKTNASTTGKPKRQPSQRQLSDTVDDREMKRQRCYGPESANACTSSAGQSTATIQADNSNASRILATVTPEPDDTSSNSGSELIVPSIQRLNCSPSTTTTSTGSNQAPMIMSEVDASKQHSNASKSVSSSTESRNSATKTLLPPTTSLRGSVLTCIFLLIAGGCAAVSVFCVPASTKATRVYEHIIPPRHLTKSLESTSRHGLSDITLRQFLTDPAGFHLGMAPSFFGFYGYFGMLAAWDEGLATTTNNKEGDTNQTTTTLFLETNQIQSVAGASAGAMAAVLLAMGIPPRIAADFCTTVTLPAFADPPGVGAAFRGDKFERIMLDFGKRQKPEHSFRLEDSLIPVAVTGFDLQTMSTLVMQSGNAARAARASATFPLLFQPVHWWHKGPTDKNKSNRSTKTKNLDYLLIDGGVLDPHGLEGLAGMDPQKPSSTNASRKKRVVNAKVGSFTAFGGAPPGPSEMPPGLEASEVLSISIQNLPGCGPWAMQNGPRARDAAYKAMMASFDLPLYRGKEAGHYELHIDASSFAPP